MSNALVSTISMSKATIESIDNSIISERVKKFEELITGGIELIKKACVLYVQTIKLYPKAQEEFREKMKWVSNTAWATWELIGRGNLYEGFALTHNKFIKLIQEMPMSEQLKLANKKIEVLCENGDMFLADFNTLAPEQKYQILDHKRVRSIPEQKAYLANQKIKEAKLYDIMSKPTTPHRQYRIYQNGSKWVVAMDKNSIYSIEQIRVILRLMAIKSKAPAVVKNKKG